MKENKQGKNMSEFFLIFAFGDSAQKVFLGENDYTIVQQVAIAAGPVSIFYLA